mmetsp:Transcript_13056/g.52293  ORF Transcript_13056/g.52293 Transcript_13056/m.52293 type:complete len:457 (+) Transcript_13056:334-1704(+)
MKCGVSHSLRRGRGELVRGALGVDLLAELAPLAELDLEVVDGDLVAERGRGNEGELGARARREPADHGPEARLQGVEGVGVVEAVKDDAEPALAEVGHGRRGGPAREPAQTTARRRRSPSGSEEIVEGRVGAVADLALVVEQLELGVPEVRRDEQHLGHGRPDAVERLEQPVEIAHRDAGPLEHGVRRDADRGELAVPVDDEVDVPVARRAARRVAVEGLGVELAVAVFPEGAHGDVERAAELEGLVGREDGGFSRPERTQNDLVPQRDAPTRRKRDAQSPLLGFRPRGRASDLLEQKQLLLARRRVERHPAIALRGAREKLGHESFARLEIVGREPQSLELGVERRERAALVSDDERPLPPQLAQKEVHHVRELVVVQRAHIAALVAAAAPRSRRRARGCFRRRRRRPLLLLREDRRSSMLLFGSLLDLIVVRWSGCVLLFGRLLFGLIIIIIII